MTNVYMAEVVKVNAFEIMEGMRHHMQAGGCIEIEFLPVLRDQFKAGYQGIKILCIQSSNLLILLICR